MTQNWNPVTAMGQIREAINCLLRPAAGRESLSHYVYEEKLREIYNLASPPKGYVEKPDGQMALKEVSDLVAAKLDDEIFWRLDVRPEFSRFLRSVSSIVGQAGNPPTEATSSSRHSGKIIDSYLRANPELVESIIQYYVKAIVALDQEVHALESKRETYKDALRTVRDERDGTESK